MNRFKRLYPVLLIVMVTACALPSTPTRIYGIFLPLENMTSDKDGSASITVSVDAEDHLKQPYIIHRKSPYQFTITKYSKWEASPRKIVMEGFRNALLLTGTFRIVKAAGFNPKDSYLLKVNLRRFERLEEGENMYGLIEMDVKLLSPGGGELYFKTLARKENIFGSGFSGLAENLSGTLEQVIKEVRTDVVRAVEKQGNTSDMYLKN